MRTFWFCATSLALTVTAAAQAPSPKPDAGLPAKPGIYKSAADIDAGLNKIKPGAASTAGGADVMIAPAPMGPISIHRRASGGDSQYAIIHPLSIEVYLITEGSATLVTGGLLDPPAATMGLPWNPTPGNPDLVRSRSIVKGESRKVSKGDVVVLPPGTPHWFQSIDGAITYLESRVRVVNR